MPPTKEVLPRVEQFAVGEQAGVAITGIVGILTHNKDVGAYGPLFGVIENFGSNDLTFSVEESSDDAATDPYAVVNLRVASANVASIVVKPLARVVFAIEGAVEDWLRLRATGTAVYGHVVIASWFGDLRREAL